MMKCFQRHRSRLCALAVLLLTRLVVATPARADLLINVDFNANGQRAGTYAEAAVLGSPGDIWNAVAGDTVDSTARAGLSLQTAGGTSSPVTLNFAGQTGFFDATNGPAIFDGSPFAALMTDYLYTHGTITGAFQDLTAGDRYRLLFYSAANSRFRVTDFTVNGSTQSVANPNGSPILAQGVTYGDFTTTPNAQGTLSFTVAIGLNGDGEANLDGIQLQDLGPAASAVPEPASLVLLGLGALGLVASRRRGRR
jgi:hypothetical protein